MTLNYSKHKTILLQILKDIYSDTSIAPHLGFVLLKVMHDSEE